MKTLEMTGNTTTKDKTGSLPEKLLKKARRTAKDSVFRDLFERRKYLMELYQVLHPEDKDISQADLEIVTIKNILLDQMYNDLGFKVRGRLLILAEAQSSWSVNILVRGLMYLVQTWQEYIQETGQSVYRSRKLDIPEPELYVIYTGERQNMPEYISLGEEFFNGHNCFIDIRIKIICCGENGNIIEQYIRFTRIFNEQVKKLGYTRKAVMETIQICKDENVLREYLESREREVIDIMMTIFDDEYILKTYIEDEKREAAKEAAKEAEEKSKKEKCRMAVKLYRLGVSVEKIAEAADISEEQVEEWLREADKEAEGAVYEK